MGTTAQRWYPSVNDWDGTDPASGDVRALETSLPAAEQAAGVDFGTSGAKEITVDPYTGARTTTGVSSAFGWAIDIAGASGMDSTATAKRVIPAGTWGYSGWLIATPVAALSAVTVGFYVYRVAASPSTTRTLLFSDSVSAGLVAAIGTAFTRTTGSQSEILLEAGETIQVTYTLSGTGQIGGLGIVFATGDQSTDCLLDVPTPGVRTRYLQSVTITGVGAATRNALAITEKTVTATGVGTAAMARQLTAARLITVTGVGTVTAPRKALTKTPMTATGVGTVAGQLQIPFRLIPDGGGGGAPAPCADSVTTAVVDLTAITGDVNPSGDLTAEVPPSTVTAAVEVLTADATMPPIGGTT